MTRLDRFTSSIQRLYDGILTILRDNPPAPPHVDDPFVDWLREQESASREAALRDRQNFVEREFERRRPQ